MLRCCCGSKMVFCWNERTVAYLEVLGLSSGYSILILEKAYTRTLAQEADQTSRGSSVHLPGEKQRWAWEIYHHTLRCFSKQTQWKYHRGNLFLKNSTEAKSCGWERRYLNKLKYSSVSLKKDDKNSLYYLKKNAILIYGSLHVSPILFQKKYIYIYIYIYILIHQNNSK